MLKIRVLIEFGVLFLLTKSIDCGVTMDIELHNPNGDCSKYIEKGLDYLEIKYSRILQFEANNVVLQKIIGNILCSPKSLKGNTLRMTCDDGVKASQENAKFVVVIAVTVKKQMLSGQIDYRYNDESMKIVKHGFLDLDKLNEQRFRHDQHIAVNSIKINGLKSYEITQEFGDCQGDYPKRLIADHGMYMSSWSMTSRKYSWMRLYFDPSGLGEGIGWHHKKS